MKHLLPHRLLLNLDLLGCLMALGCGALRAQAPAPVAESAENTPRQTEVVMDVAAVK